MALLILASSCIAADPPSAPHAGPNSHQLITVPAGTYTVGGPDAPRNPRRKVTLTAAYSIATTETTNAQFAAFVAATGYVTDAEKLGTGKVSHEGMADWDWDQVPRADWRHPEGPGGPGWEQRRDHPVTQISGADAEAYCKWLGVRLPTLDEWEIAARADTTTLYPWGDKYDPKRANTWNGPSHRHNTRDDGFLYTAPVKSFSANAWGLYDVIGNVFEYCSGLPPDARSGDEAHLIAGRGGSWWCSFSTCHFFNLVDIGRMDRHGTLSNQGFRIAMDAEQGTKKKEK